ncbi:hypothetical protein [Methylomonas albis]|nr:hypothetical protein [Methylomonas albis]
MFKGYCTREVFKQLIASMPIRHTLPCARFGEIISGSVRL